jgi:hypothetical protein
MTKGGVQLTIAAAEPFKLVPDQFLMVLVRGQPTRDDLGSTESAFSAALLISEE